MRKAFFFFAPFLLFSCIFYSGFSQTPQYKIEILDAVDSLPASFSTISWGNGQGTISDENGFARLNADATDTVRISGIGYRTRLIATDSLSIYTLNTVYLTPEVFEIGEIQVEGKKRKALTSTKIIRKAISSIWKNYPVDPVVYHAYYREYSKQENSYINVLESIIDLQDPGIRSIDNFQASLLFKRLNQQFPTDSRLLVPYDNRNKYVPHSVMPISLNNELLILRAHDPVRNYKSFSFDFIGILQDDFEDHHEFKKQKITFSDSIPYYMIEFSDNLNMYTLDGESIEAEGSIYINAIDYGISRLSYTTYSENELGREKLFEVNVEYRKQKESYYLNYISFNNLYKCKHLAENDQSFITESYYQYRELFVKEYREDQRLESAMIDKSIPVFSNPISSPETEIDTSWINTPLIAEEIRSDISKLYKLNTLNQNEMVYIQTDREVYNPGDTVWVKAYIRNKADLKATDNSAIFNLRMFNESGREIGKYQYLVKDAHARGQFPIDFELDEGYYYLAGYSSWMKNYDPDQVSLTKILVKEDKEISYQMVPAFDQASYLPGDTARIAISCLNNFNQASGDVAYRYAFKSEGGTLVNGKGVTAGGDENLIEFVIPYNSQNDLSLRLIAMHNKVRLETDRKILIKNKLQIGFYPEGGRCINNHSSFLAFKATDNNGAPIHVRGKIIDQEGQTGDLVSSDHDGMGKFHHTPVKGQSFWFVVTEPSVLSDTFQLPRGSDMGWGLTAGYQGHMISVEIRNTSMKKEPALLVLRIRDQFYFGKKLLIRQKDSIQIPSTDLPQGIGVLTVFDEHMVPQAERLIFVNHEDANRVRFLTGSANYTPRDSVQLKIKVSTADGKPVSGDYSLSVIDDELGSSPLFEQNSIVSSFLISSEIRGRIHDPNYYSDLSDPVIRSHLDLLLLTQGWRNYNYIGDLVQIDSMQAPVGQDAISGQLKRIRFGMNPRPTQGNVTVNYGFNKTDVTTDKQGLFSFQIDYNNINSPEIFLVATDSHGSEKVELKLDPDEFGELLPSFLSDYINLETQNPDPVLSYQSIEDKYSLELKNHQWIEEVIIRAEKRKKEEGFETIDLVFSARTAREDQLDGAHDVLDVLSNMGYSVILEEYVCGDSNSFTSAQIMHRGHYTNIQWYINDVFATGCMFIANNRLVLTADDYSLVSHIRPEEIDRISLIKGIRYIRPSYGRDYEIVVDISYSPKFNTRAPLNTWYINQVSLAKEFYSPMYDTPEKTHSFIQDLRKTIYWDPEVSLDENGECNVVFYNADRYTKVKCTLEGISDKGIPVSSKAHYRVTLQK